MEDYRFIAHQRELDNKKQSVQEHLLNVATLTMKHSSKIGLPIIGKVIGLLHDLGKYSYEFQTYINSAVGNIDPDSEEYIDVNGKKGKIDHSTAGAQFIQFKDHSHMAFPYIKQITSLCLASHHGGLIDCIAPDGTDKFTKRMNKSNDHTHLKEVLEKCSPEIITLINEAFESDDIFDEVDSLLRSVKGQSFNVGMITRFLFSCLLDADRTDTADFENPENQKIRLNTKYPDWHYFIEVLEKRLSEFPSDTKVNKIRSKISLECKESGCRAKGIYTMTVPTGGGKTLASLRFSLEHARIHNLDRIIYVIPYTSIIDQNAREVQNIFKSLSSENNQGLVLEHHSNLTPEKETTQQRIMAENWDAPIVFTTSVQLLDSLFKGGTRSARRMHNLAKSVIVFDEIQTLPIKTIYLFNKAMNFLTQVCGSSILLCTATQPHLHKVNPKNAIKLSSPCELTSDVPQLFRELRRVEIIDKQQVGGLMNEEIAQLVQDELLHSGSVLVIVNTKKSAQALYELCQDFKAEVYHLSTNQCPQHRLDIIDRIRELADPGSEIPVICISTQLIEAGVDVDFGSVIRYTAGLDSIAQAAGRCNRNGRRKELGRVLIVNPVNEKISSLDDIKKGKEVTLRILDEFKTDPEIFKRDLLSKEAMDSFFQYYFYQRSNEMDYPVSGVVDDTLLQMLSTNKKARMIYGNSNLKLNQSFTTAGKLFNVIDSPTQGIIVPYRNGEKIIADLLATKMNMPWRTKLLKSAQRYTVNIYENTLAQLIRLGALEEIEGGLLYLRKEYYSNDYGVSFNELLENYIAGSYCC